MTPGDDDAPAPGDVAYVARCAAIGVYGRQLLLCTWRRPPDEEIPVEYRDFRVVQRSPAASPPVRIRPEQSPLTYGSTCGATGRRLEESPYRARTSRPSAEPPPLSLPPAFTVSSSSSARASSSGIYKRRFGPQSHEAEITRGVQQMLNVVCPENVGRIVERFEGINIQGADDLKLIISLVIRKVLEEPHYCETYADLVCSLRSRYPEFPPEAEGERPITFRSVLLEAVQIEWEDSQQVGEGCDPGDCLATQRKRGLANVKFIGHLFLRRLIASQVLKFVFAELFKSTEENMVEFFCQLLQVVGRELEATPWGQQLLAVSVARLLELRDATGWRTCLTCVRAAGRRGSSCTSARRLLRRSAETRRRSSARPPPAPRSARPPGRRRRRLCGEARQGWRSRMLLLAVFLV
eukprot:TRINITY_DN19011_c0_g1_i1.p1 TRINITY_DN19011_c0_g1~~TRINITY_DN19011_c0_g1_i1.p1  ORF type:complete len:408 (-),score=70.52 TRINITY_DN19011_c0_g1_i1:654-1877(-)